MNSRTGRNSTGRRGEFALKLKAPGRVSEAMTISVKNLPEMLDDPNSSDMLRFVVSADAKRFILRLKQQTQISDDEVLAFWP